VAYVPSDAKWFLAEIVEEITVEGDAGNVVHTNLVLVRADSPEEAYQKSMDLGVGRELSYENPDGKRATKRFKGLRDLLVIYEELKHGAGLIYSEDRNVDESVLRGWIAKKEDLAVFQPAVPPTGPD
jgi:hypothetical protein